MDTKAILTQLYSERDRIQAAIDALEALDKAASPAPATASTAAPAKATGAKRGRKPKRHMSAEARAKIAAATKARWARMKAIGSAKAPKTAGRPKKATKKRSKAAEKVPF